MDHMLGNLELLHIPLTKGIECEIIDQQNRIRLLDGPILLEKMADWKYVSFLSYTDQTQGITLKGFVYNVEMRYVMRRQRFHLRMGCFTVFVHVI